MNTLKFKAAKVREYFEANCADEYLSEYAKPVAEILKPGLKWRHANFAGCPVTKAYDLNGHWEADDDAVPVVDLAKNVDRSVRALSEHGTIISDREIELI